MKEYVITSNAVAGFRPRRAYSFDGAMFAVNVMKKALAAEHKTGWSIMIRSSDMESWIFKG